jgi:Holliday junction DNA helicase RuvA
MIAKLTGRLDSIGKDGGAVIDVQGVGYLVFCSLRTLAWLESAKAELVSLLIETHVREDQFQLYGFADPMERECFRVLTTVPGVGNRTALAILGVLAPEALAQAIAAQDRVALTRAEGVGPKLAVRILGELKDKAAKLAFHSSGNSFSGPFPGSFPGPGPGPVPVPGPVPGRESVAITSPFPASLPVPPVTGETAALADAVSALVNLGYGRSEAFAAVTGASRQIKGDIRLSELIRFALRELSGGNG